ncbi:MAG: hypothetical protein LUH05_06715, partial [Candidatus Gastranaerophilales bacterium]|nr:hypothetical protein [Candidatus Gastranaerophilales bacterium]
KASEFRIKRFPEINIDKAEIWVEKGEIDSIFVILSEIHILNQNEDKTICSFQAEIISNLLKNLISIGKKGYLYIDDNALYANDLQVEAGRSEITVNGKIIDDDKDSDFTVIGNDIPISDVVSSLIYFQKLKSPGKKFIENFYDFSGLTDIDVNITKEGLFGDCIAKNLAAKTTLFDVPILFKNIVFKLNKKDMSASSLGFLGGEQVYTSFNLTDMGGENQEVKGVVKARLSDKSAGKYVPNLSVLGFADTSVDYAVKNKKIYVNYLLKLDKGSDLLYGNAFLGLRDKDRRLFVNTVKEPDKLYITHYDYSVKEDGLINNIILGDGLLVKKDGHLTPDFITCKTNGYAPVSVTGSFGKYIEKGLFSGDLKFDFNKNLLTGIFSVKDTLFKGFFVKEAKINADEKVMKIDANGEYQKSPFDCRLEALNYFSTDRINVYNMYLFLDEFIIKTGNSKPKKPSKKLKDIALQAKNADIDIDNWTIKLNKIKRNRIEFSDILLNGSLKDDIFRFTVPHINFANGILTAEGLYDIKKRSSDISFSAKNIDSNTVADVIFELPNQIEGLADAKLHARLENGFDDIKANASFSVKQGYLPQLGSTSFMIKNSRKKQPIKFKLSDIINVDIKNMKALSSDIDGEFYFDDESIKDVKITSSQKYLSLLIEGDYNLSSKYGNLDLWGKYNNNQITKIKILFVPLSWIVKLVFRPETSKSIYKDKLEEVPNIEAGEGEESAFRVKINGNLNNNDIKVELKSIR